jgi:hypothetical protein
MPELQTNSPADPADPLSKLHKMSTTAGLGSGDYVAVNITAVLAALFGLASALALFDKIMLAIPVVGVITALIALRQIGRSNGTQTGKGIAIAGLVLSLGIGGFVIAGQAAHTLSRRADQQEIAGLIDKLEQTIKDQKPAEGYKLFGGAFHQRVTPERYAEQMSVYHQEQVKQMWGDFVSLKWNGHIQFVKDDRTGEETAATYGIGTFAKPDVAPHRYGMAFRKVQQKGWVIENMPDLFPLEGAQRPAGAPQGQ